MYRDSGRFVFHGVSLVKDRATPFTQILPTRVCFTNAGINNNNILSVNMVQHTTGKIPKQVQ